MMGAGTESLEAMPKSMKALEHTTHFEPDQQDLSNLTYSKKRDNRDDETEVAKEF